VRLARNVGQFGPCRARQERPCTGLICGVGANDRSDRRGLPGAEVARAEALDLAVPTAKDKEPVQWQQRWQRPLGFAEISLH
jgi:hypothetical protein